MRPAPARSEHSPSPLAAKRGEPAPVHPVSGFERERHRSFAGPGGYGILRHRKKPRRLFPGLLLALGLLAASSGKAGAVTLQVDQVHGTPGRWVDVAVTVGNYGSESVAGAAFTLVYSTSHLTLTEMGSGFFDTFLDQWNALQPVPNPLPPTSVVLNGLTFTRSLRVLTIEGTPLGKTLVAGARVRAGTPGDLLTLRFWVPTTTPPGTYSVSIVPTVIRDVSAGYAVGGEPVPVLVDAVPGQGGTSTTYPEYVPILVDGAITVAVFLDTDGDTMDDNWERDHFHNLNTATATSDYDKDGYSDRQEYFNSAVLGGNDPDGAPYDPTVANAPGGTGYTTEILSGIFPLLLP